MSAELKLTKLVKKTFPKNTRFNFEDFLIACPFSIEYLRQKNRKTEVMQWRQIGMCWYAIEFNHVSDAGRFFNKDHSTVCHSMRQLLDRKYNPLLQEKIDKVLQYMELEIADSNDMNEKEKNSLIYLEKIMRIKLGSVEK